MALFLSAASAGLFFGSSDEPAIACSPRVSTRPRYGQLFYSERTVKNIIHDITSRLELRNRTHAVAYAIKAGLILRASAALAPSASPALANRPCSAAWTLARSMAFA